MATTELVQKSSETLARTRHPRPRRDGAWPKGQALGRKNRALASAQPREVGGLARKNRALASVQPRELGGLARKNRALASAQPKEVGGLASYAELRRRVQQTLLRAQRQIEETKIRAYWDAGRDINEHIKIHGGRAEYGKKVILQLARHLKLDDSVLDRFSQLAAAFPKEMIEKLISATWRKLPAKPRQTSKNDSSAGLSWSHFRLLIPVKEKEVRFRLAEQAARYGWTVEKLEARIKSLSGREKSGIKSLPAPQGSRSTSALLKPKKGELFIYRIVEDAGVLALDYGFTSYWNLSGQEAKKFRAGDIIRKLPSGKMENLKEGSQSLLYTYEADVTRVVDGDTIWMKIYLEGRGRPPWVKEKLRLRGIDAPEIKTPEGRAAKKFVEEQVAGKRIIITTTKPDKWDRYLSDVFLTLKDGPEIFLNNLLLEKGHARIKTDWLLEDWEA